ncbi:spirocyclase AveC family protein [Mycolicibacterium vaccae]|uniref:spirocyclase AveC family protein n=1 Tax=Mycolicibacterium vaccae TaxID=1810 RepID=UPI003CF6404A
MDTALSPALIAGLAFAYVGGILFLAFGVYLSIRRGRLHPLLLVSISAISFSWIEAPYDWAVYAQFPPELPRMPSWWPLNMTWGGGLPSAVPIGYIAYFVLPAVIGAALGRKVVQRFGWRRPQTLLAVGFAVGFCWALLFNGFFGPRLGVFVYGYVIDGLAIFQGSRYQYPVYDAVAMGLQMMVFTYLLGRVDGQGRNVIEVWSDKRSSSKVGSSLLSVAAVVVVGHLMYGAVFAPHLATKLGGYVTEGPTEQLWPPVENQPR